MPKHWEEVAPFGVHVIHFKGATDPSLDADNFVASGKRWWDTANGLMKVRNDDDDDWDTLYEIGANAGASEAYVDAAIAGAITGLSWKQAVRAATAAAGTLASDFENGDTVDGVVLATGDRILIKDQAAGAENGIYVVAASGAPTRATDADAGAELVNATVYVSEGTTNADTQWTCSTNAPITPGSTALTFARLTSGGAGIPTNTIDAKGDLLVGTANDTVARRAVGTNGQVLTADSAETDGVKWATPSSGVFSGARVRNTNVNQSINSASQTPITWDTEDFDTDGYHSTVSNTSRLTVPANGKYLVGGCIEYINNNTGARYIMLRKNGTTEIASVDTPGNVGAGGLNLSVGVCTLVELAATDYIDLCAFQDSGIAVNVTHANGQRSNFWIQKVG